MMKRLLTNLRIRSRLIFGFSAICLILLASIGTTMWKVAGSNQATQSMVDVRVPTAMAGDRLVGQLYASLAALRGWMLTGNEAFKTERSAVWQSIDTSVTTLDGLAQESDDPRDREDWANAKAVLAEFRTAQADVEKVANTIDELPASKILMTDAAPLGAGFVEQITAMINDEAQQPADAQRKAMLGAMADVRGSFAMGLASIRAYLLSGDPKFKADFEKFWAVNEKRFGNLADSSALFTPVQAAAFEKLAAARKSFAPL